MGSQILLAREPALEASAGGASPDVRQQALALIGSQACAPIQIVAPLTMILMIFFSHEHFQKCMEFCMFM